MKKLKLGRKTISVDSAPYIIAEIGVNYENNMDRAKKLIMKRPGIGISPTKIKYVLGKRAKTNLNDDTILSWKDIK